VFAAVAGKLRLGSFGQLSLALRQLADRVIK